MGAILRVSIQRACAARQKLPQSETIWLVILSIRQPSFVLIPLAVYEKQRVTCISIPHIPSGTFMTFDLTRQNTFLV
jgi:hypothetical protein